MRDKNAGGYRPDAQTVEYDSALVGATPEILANYEGQNEESPHTIRWATTKWAHNKPMLAEVILKETPKIVSAIRWGDQDLGGDPDRGEPKWTEEGVRVCRAKGWIKFKGDDGEVVNPDGMTNDLGWGGDLIEVGDTASQAILETVGKTRQDEILAATNQGRDFMEKKWLAFDDEAFKIAKAEKEKEFAQAKKTWPVGNFWGEHYGGSS